MIQKLRWTLIVALLAGVCVSTSPALGQGGSITYGQSVGGSIMNGGIDSWSFYGSAGDVISITLYADGESSLNTVLYLKDSSNTQLSWNDDYYGTDAAILGFTLPSSGTFTIEASGSGEGGYTLWLTLDMPGGISNPDQPSAETGQEALPISYGETVTGKITATIPFIDYVFNGNQGDEVTLTAISQDGIFDPYLTLYDSQGNFLVSDDDSYIAPNAQIVLLLPFSNVYTVRVQAYKDITTGSYSLTLSTPILGVLPTPPSGPPVLLEAIEIDYGDTLDGEIPAEAPNTLAIYVFDGKQGEQAIMTATSQTPNFDPYMALYDSSNSLIAFDDDRAGNLNPGIVIKLPFDDTYTIQVGASRQASSGSFTLLLDEFEGDIPTVTSDTPAPDIVPPPTVAPGTTPSPTSEVD